MNSLNDRSSCTAVHNVNTKHDLYIFILPVRSDLLVEQFEKNAEM